MKSLRYACVVSIVTLVILVTLYVDHFWSPFLGLPAGVAPGLAFAIIAINMSTLLVAATQRRHSLRLAWTTMGLSVVQVAALLVTT